MTSLALDRVTKRFGAALALDRVSLAAEPGAFLALLGPSGCGKTTVLRLLAGFEEPGEGVVSVGGRPVSGHGAHVPPEKRNVAMVFQSYALWPHMNVSENVAYPLATAGVKKATIAERVATALRSVGLEGYADRRPEALSGGQRQRVALARALVQDAPLVLCDEPLANLDVHLRASMIDTFRRLHRETGRTFVYVTHDQAEALALATTIVVLDEGRLVQVGTPHMVYAEPATVAVARFVGEGRLVACAVEGPADGDSVRVRLAGMAFAARAAPGTGAGPAKLLVRPEAVALASAGVAGLPVTVTSVVYRGAFHTVEATLTDGQPLVTALPAAPRLGETLHLAINDAWVVPGA